MLSFVRHVSSPGLPAVPDLRRVIAADLAARPDDSATDGD